MSGGVLSGEDVGATPRRFLPLLRGHNPGTIRTDGLGEGLPVFPKLLTRLMVREVGPDVRQQKMRKGGQMGLGCDKRRTSLSSRCTPLGPQVETREPPRLQD